MNTKINHFKPYILPFLIVLIIGSAYRIVPLFIHAQSTGKDELTTDLIRSIRKNIDQKVQKKLPLLPDEARQKIVDAQTIRYFSSHRQEIDRLIQKRWSRIPHNPLRGNDYLIGADSYYYLGLTQNILEKGFFSFQVRSGRYYNNLMVAPGGHWYFFDLHPYSGYLTHLFFKFFSKEMTLSGSVRYTPLILSGLALLLFFIYASRVHISALSTFITGVFFTLSPIYFQRSLIGWYDTDIYNVIFPLSLLWSAQCAFLRDRRRMTILHMSVCASLTGLYSLFWSGWLYAPVAIICALVLLMIFSRFSARKLRTRTIIEALLTYVAVLISILMILKGPGGIADTLTDGLNRVAAKNINSISLWPDMFLMVGELKSPGILKIIVLSGGRLFAIMAVLGLIMLMRNMARDKNDPFVPVLPFLISFIFAGFLMSVSAERFTILLVSPLAVLAAYGTEKVRQYVKNTPAPFGVTGAARAVKGASPYLLTSLVIVPIFYTAIVSTRPQPVKYNVIWERATNFLRKQTPEDAVINTWWAPGHFVTSQARRRVTFDGATLEIAQGYWIAKALITDNELLSRNILRMINTSANQSVEFLLSKGFSLSGAIALIETVLAGDIERARLALNDFLKAPDIPPFLELTHNEGPPGYCLVYNDLVEKIIALAFVGRWDFKKAEQLLKLSKENPNLYEKILSENAGGDIVNLLWGISGGPLYYGSKSKEITRRENIITFENGVSVDTNQMTLTLDEKNPLSGKIGGIIMVQGDTVTKKILNSPEARPLSVIVFEKLGKFYCLAADNRLCRSILFRLYYLRGDGLEHFESVFEDYSENTDILIYRMV